MTRNNAQYPADYDRLLKKATIASLTTALILIGAKLVAWQLTGSVSVLASFVDSLMDVFASAVNFFAVRFALTPADDEHRFGHGKAEYLAGLGQAVFICSSAVYLMIHGIERMLHPQPVEDIEVGLVVMGFSIVATVVLLAYQRRVIAATNSSAIKADALHYRSDLLSNLAIIFALVFSFFGWPLIDPVLGICIALYIFYSAWVIGYEAVQMLLDRALPEEDHALIREIVLKEPEVMGIHDVRTRQSGYIKIIQMHIELDGRISLVEAHAIADRVEMRIKQAFPGADVIIHQDPYISDNEIV